MGCCADGGGEAFCSDEEGYCVGAELVEEAAEEVHGLECMDVFWRGVVFEVEGGDDEEDEIHEESDLLHPFSAVELVVDEEGWNYFVVRKRMIIKTVFAIKIGLTSHIIPHKGNANVDHII